MKYFGSHSSMTLRQATRYEIANVLISLIYSGFSSELEPRTSFVNSASQPERSPVPGTSAVRKKGKMPLST
jgi:hypothetical protein